MDIQIVKVSSTQAKMIINVSVNDVDSLVRSLMNTKTSSIDNQSNEVPAEKVKKKYVKKSEKPKRAYKKRKYKINKVDDVETETTQVYKTLERLREERRERARQGALKAWEKRRQNMRKSQL